MLDRIRSSAESWLIKVVFGVIIVAFVLGFGYSALRQQNRNTTGVLAYVNDTAISVNNFLARLHISYPNERPDTLREDGRAESLLQDMIVEELSAQECARLGIAVSDQEVQDAIMQMVFFQDLNNNFNSDLYKRQLQGIGISTAFFESVVRRDLLRQKLAEYVSLAASVDEAEAREQYDFETMRATVEYIALDAEEFTNATEATDQEIEAYYAENSEEFRVPDRLDMNYLLFTPSELASMADVSQEEIETYYEARKDNEYMQQERVKAKHILVPVPRDADEAAVEEAHAKAQAMYDRLQSGESYDDLFAEVEADADLGLAQDLGWFPRGQMAEEFEQAAFEVPAGTYSEPVLTMFGWHIILVQEHEAARPTPLADLQDDIRQTIAEKKAASLINDILDTAIVQVYAGDSLETIAQDLGMELHQSGPFTLSGNLDGVTIDEDALPDLFALDAGAVTDWPVPVQNGFLLAEITEKRPTEVLPLDQVDFIVEQDVLDAKAKELARARADELLAQARDTGEPDQEAVAFDRPIFRSAQLNYGSGLPQDMVDDLFRAEPGHWLPQYYEDNAGFVLVKLVELIQSTDEEWEESRQETMDYLLEQRRNLMVNAYFANLYDKAQVDTVDDAEPYWRRDEVNQP